MWETGLRIAIHLGGALWSFPWQLFFVRLFIYNPFMSLWSVCIFMSNQPDYL